MSSKGISCISVAVWSLERKCSEAAVGLEMLVCLSTVLRCLLKRSLSRRLVQSLIVTTVSLFHVNDVFRVAVDVMINTSCFTGRMKYIIGKSVRQTVAVNRRVGYFVKDYVVWSLLIDY